MMTIDKHIKYISPFYSWVLEELHDTQNGKTEDLSLVSLWAYFPRAYFFLFFYWTAS